MTTPRLLSHTFDIAMLIAGVVLFVTAACAGWRCAGAPTKALVTGQPLIVPDEDAGAGE